jgi:hypothetical protein
MFTPKYTVLDGNRLSRFSENAEEQQKKEINSSIREMARIKNSKKIKKFPR